MKIVLILYMIGLSNGSWCGNDVDSQKRWLENILLICQNIGNNFYGFDGFRFG